MKLEPEDYTIKQLKDKLADVEPEAELIKILRQDSRTGVRDLAAKMSRQIEKQEQLKNLWHERSRIAGELRDRGFEAICGLDEAGRGALAGPVAAAAVILPEDCYIAGLDDSKQLKPERRIELAAEIRVSARAWAVGMVSPEVIDEIGILPSVKRAMINALKKLDLEPDYLLIDGRISLKELKTHQKALEKGDGRVNCIAAASILAKVMRDAVMKSLDDIYSGYKFAGNMGYGTSHHRRAIECLGPSRLHRRSFGGVRRDEAENPKKPKRQKLPFSDSPASGQESGR
ncbi:ribonuclease HII [Halarsenatibacter silvermanii]|uniref:Ribonuclease HII n=1 Tax=Halarsenatibacter silvermanii TaxID=321763 RepID=A0A1G9PGH7_9FIRM|nr:ribonuclease HII [Halarsenatibacter silvermanii]SDL97972.1 RNase HII [Halarsenatibacter silvermanii]